MNFRLSSAFLRFPIEKINWSTNFIKYMNSLLLNILHVYIIINVLPKSQKNVYVGHEG